MGAYLNTPFSLSNTQPDQYHKTCEYNHDIIQSKKSMYGFPIPSLQNYYAF